MQRSRPVILLFGWHEVWCRQSALPRLSKFLRDADHDSVHVEMVGLASASDSEIWEWAGRDGRIVISKDEDLLFLAMRPHDTGKLVWVRLGNCRHNELTAAFGNALDSIVAAFDSGQRIVEVR